MKKITLLLLVLILCACSAAPAVPTATETAQPAATHTPLPTATALPTHTPQPTTTATPLPTNTPLPTDTPTVTPTPTPLPAEAQTRLIEDYKVILLIQMNANFLKEAASRLASGELSQDNNMQVVIGLSLLMTAADEAITSTVVLDLIQPYWNQALPVHAKTKNIFGRWFAKEIDDKAVMDEITAPLAEIDKILTDLDEKLATVPGVNTQEMTAMRDEANKSLADMFTAVTPAATEGGAPSLKVLSHQSYVESDWYNIIGELQNTGTQPAEYVEVVVTLYDEKENVVDTGAAYSELDIVPPGGKSPFSFSTDKWTGVTHYKLQVQGQTGVLPAQSLEISNHHSYTDTEWSYFYIIGEINNKGEKPMDWVKVIATLYDEHEQVVGTNITYSSLDTIPAGGKSPFELSTSHFVSMTHYSLQVEGDEADAPRQDLEITQSNLTQDGDTLTILGEVKNTGSTPAEFVKIVVSLYDKQGNLVGVITTNSELDGIPAGETSAFEGWTNHGPKYDHYEIQVQGN